MSFKGRIAEHILCVTIDLNEAQQELLDAQLKVNELAAKLNELIKMQDHLRYDKGDNNACIDSGVNCTIGDNSDSTAE